MSFARLYGGTPLLSSARCRSLGRLDVDVDMISFDLRCTESAQRGLGLFAVFGVLDLMFRANARR